MAEAAWRLVEVADLCARASASLQETATALGEDLVARVRAGQEIRVAEDGIAQVRELLQSVSDVADRARSAIDAVAVEDVAVDLDAARAGAAAEFVDPGIVEHERVLLAVSLFSVPRGCALLAEALRSVDRSSLWKDVTVGSLIASFLGSSPSVAEEIAARAQVAPQAMFGELEDDQVEQLVAALEGADPDREA